MHLAASNAVLRRGQLIRILVGLALVVLASSDSRSFRSPADAWHAVPFQDQTGSPTHLTSYAEFTLYSSLWFNNQRYHAVTETGASQVAAGRTTLGQSTALNTFPTRSAKSLYTNLQGHWLEGTSVLLDFPTPAFPDSMGHWTEVLVPLFCVLASDAWRTEAGHAPIQHIIFTNLNTGTLDRIFWVWAMLEVALSPAKLRKRPRLLFWDDLDAVDRQHWLCFQQVLVASDRYAHADRLSGFRSKELGQAFRQAAFWLQGLQRPERPTQTITLMTGLAAEEALPENVLHGFWQCLAAHLQPALAVTLPLRTHIGMFASCEVVNQHDLLEALEDTASVVGMQVRPYTVTPEAPFSSFLSVMARTGILIARHGPTLANAIFLPPGALVVELLPYLYEWEGSSLVYKNLTQSVGDIHHVAWRARRAEHVVYETQDDARFEDWTAGECSSQDCLEIHAEAAMLVDCPAVQELIHRMLPHFVQGSVPQDVDLPWPAA